MTNACEQLAQASKSNLGKQDRIREALKTATSGWEALLSDDSDVYVAVPGRPSSHPVKARSTAVSDILKQVVFDETQLHASDRLVEEHVSGLISRTRLKGGAPETLHVRVGWTDREIVIDLGTETFECVRIDADGWRVDDRSPVLFKRPDGMRALPLPVREGDISLLASHLHFADRKDFIIVCGFLLGALWQTGPFHPLVVYGQRGSSKSTMSLILKSIIDPGSPSFRSLDNGTWDTYIGAGHSYLIVLDNISSLSSAQSDLLCSLSTGGGFNVRARYSNDQEITFEAKRPIIMNGIESFVRRDDLMDRSLVVECPEITKDVRKTEEEVFSDFERELPAILGGLYDAASEALRNRFSPKPERLPRKADFAVWVSGAEVVLGLEPGGFLKTLWEHEEARDAELFLESPVARYIQERVDENGILEATCGQLIEQVKSWSTKGHGVPSTPQGMAAELRRVAPLLRSKNIEMTKKRGGSNGDRLRVFLRLNAGD